MSSKKRNADSGCNYPIDFVVLWVDGADPKWLKKRLKYDSESTTKNFNARYRDWGTFKYWFRGVELYAPWVNHIYLVTDNQKPDWMNEYHPKLTIVDHKEIMNAKDLPTFNSQAIEMNLHRIPNLSEHFVYFNDDTFIVNKVKPADFFKNGLPVEMANINAATGMDGDQLYAQTMFNDVLLINRHFKKQEIVKKHFLKWINPKYGIINLRTISQLPYPFFTGYKPQHLSTSFLKSTFIEVWHEEKDVLENTCSHKFRHHDDVNQDVFVQWQLCKNLFAPRASRIGRHIIFKDNGNIKDISKVLFSVKKKLLCINDGFQKELTDLEYKRAYLALSQLFEKKFPRKSDYEK